MPYEVVETIAGRPYIRNTDSMYSIDGFGVMNEAGEIIANFIASRSGRIGCDKSPSYANMKGVQQKAETLTKIILGNEQLILPHETRVRLIINTVSFYTTVGAIEDGVGDNMTVNNVAREALAKIGVGCAIGYCALIGNYNVQINIMGANSIADLYQ
jgi:hypothetical protein